MAIISATNQISVEWVTERVLNRLLAKRGAHLTIPVSCVHGVRLETAPDTGRLSSAIAFPAPTFAGKAALVQAQISASPLLVAGDSENDFAMLALAPFRVWVELSERPGHPAQFIRHFDGFPHGVYILIAD